jgi:tripartite ATP-independent transporter DctP family solute receptor
MITRRGLLAKMGYVGVAAATGTLLQACANSSGPATSAAPPVSASPTGIPSATPAAFTGTFSIRVGLSTGPDAAPTKGANQWAAAVADRSQQHVKVEVFPSAQLGSSDQLLTQVRSGALDATIVDTQNFTSLDSRYNVISLPYLFAEDKAQALFDSAIGREMLTYLEPKGVKGLAWSIFGLRGVANRQRTASLPSDYKGVKVRADGSIFVDFWTQLGAQVVAMPGNEIYLSLSRGVIDAADTSAGFAFAQKFYEVARFYTNTAHSIGLGMVVYNLSRFQQLPAEVQNLLKTTAEEAGKTISAETIKQDQSAFSSMRSKDVNVIETVDIEAWRAATKPVFDKYAGQLPSSLVSAIQQAVR